MKPTLEFLHPSGHWEPAGRFVQPHSEHIGLWKLAAQDQAKCRGFPHRVRDYEKQVILYECDERGQTREPSDAK